MTAYLLAVAELEYGTGTCRYDIVLCRYEIVLCGYEIVLCRVQFRERLPVFLGLCALRRRRYARRVEFVYLRYLVWVLPPRRGGTRRPPYLRRKYGGTRARATVADFGSFRVRGTGTRYVSAAGMPYESSTYHEL